MILIYWVAFSTSIKTTCKAQSDGQRAAGGHSKVDAGGVGRSGKFSASAQGHLSGQGHLHGDGDQVAGDVLAGALVVPADQ